MLRRVFTWRSVAVLCVLCPGLIRADSEERRRGSQADLSTFVVVGDSLAAGFQNFSLLDVQQVHGFANLIAQQAGTPLALPLVPCPGVPNLLHLAGLGPPPIVLPVPGTLGVPRDNPLQQATNLAVPGMFVADALNKAPSPVINTAIDAMTNIVLGFPEPVLSGFTTGPDFSQVQWAVALQPSTILVWIGNNDALFAALTGDFNQLTPLPSFRESYKTLLGTLSQTKATLVTANIPDVTEVPFFTPVEQFAAQVGLPFSIVSHLLGVSAGDFLRPGGLAAALQILANRAQGPLPHLCDAGLPGLPPQSPCVLSAQDATTIRNAIAGFNDEIAADSQLFGATLVDTHALVDDLHANGIVVGGRLLTTAFLGGLISLDGVHPTNTGHAIIANQFIKAMNRQLTSAIPPVSVEQVAQTDPMISPAAALASRTCQ